MWHNEQVFRDSLGFEAKARRWWGIRARPRPLGGPRGGHHRPQSRSEASAAGKANERLSLSEFDEDVQVKRVACSWCLAHRQALDSG
jgi:hypothetical protein